MELQETVNAIKERHSVRSYTDKRIEGDKIKQLEELIAECNEKGNLHLQFLEDAGSTFNRLLNRAMGLGSAPSVIACVGKDDATLDERCGYYGEQVVLLAQHLGLNTCWAGTYNAKNVKAEIAAGERLVIVIAIGYGVNGGNVRKSKTADQVSCGNNRPKWFDYGVELALMAPTAVNQQKFMIEYKEDGTAEVTDRKGIMSKVDLGIVKYHFEVGAAYAKNNE